MTGRLSLGLVFLLLVGPLGLVAGGCVQGDTGDDDGQTTATPAADDDGTPAGTEAPSEGDPALVGTWVSEGDDVSDLLAPWYGKLEATFNTDLTYEVMTTDTGGAPGTLSGTYTTSASGVDGIMNIILWQTAPNSVTSEGIYQLDESGSPIRMTYEVAQTDPSVVGVTPPTAEAGFGSTSGGDFGTQNIQYYSRQ